jgi:TldD protein
MTDEPKGAGSAVSRRDFLLTTAAGVAVAGLPLSLQAGTAAKAGGAPMADHFKRFGVDETLVRRAMSEAMGRGGDYCDLYFQHTVSTGIGLRDKAVNQARTAVDLGVGIRVLKGEQVGYSFTEDLSPEAILKAARTAAAIASGKGGRIATRFTEVKHPEYHRIGTPWEEIRADRKVPLLQRVNEAIFNGDKRIIKANVFYNDEYSHVLIATSDGRLAYDYRPMCTIGASAVGELDKRREDAYFALSAREELAFFTPERLDRIASEVLARVSRGFEAIKPEGGEMEVVLAPGGGGHPASRGHRPRPGGGLQPQEDLHLRRQDRQAHRRDVRHHRG